MGQTTLSMWNRVCYIVSNLKMLLCILYYTEKETESQRLSNLSVLEFNPSPVLCQSSISFQLHKHIHKWLASVRAGE